MASSSPKNSYWQGVRASLPFIIAVGPFGMVYGVIAVESGLTILESIVFSVAVFAGAAQLAALQLMAEGAPLLVIIATALAVNLRMAMYSASLAPYLGSAPLWQRMAVAFLNADQPAAIALTRYESEPGMSVAERTSYFLGLATPTALSWVAGSIVGALGGSAIAAALPTGFVLPVMFAALFSVMLRTLAHWIAAAVSVVVALALNGLPLNAGLLIAAGVAMAAGALVETIRGPR